MPFTSTDASVFSSLTTAWQTASQIAVRAGLPSRTVRYSLSKLAESTLVLRLQSAPAHYYKRNPEPVSSALASLVSVSEANGISL